MGVNNGWEVFYTQMRAAVRSQETLQTRLEYVVMIVSSLSRDHFQATRRGGGLRPSREQQQDFQRDSRAKEHSMQQLPR